MNYPSPSVQSIVDLQAGEIKRLSELLQQERETVAALRSLLDLRDRQLHQVRCLANGIPPQEEL